VNEVSAGNLHIARIECLWEPLMILAARLRAALGVPGMSVEETLPFRDKEVMKSMLDAAGIRTPHHARCTDESQCRAAAERIGFPLIAKPIDGAGSADTHRVNDAADLDRVLPLIRHVPEVSIEEFIEGREFTFDTICAGGEVLFHNMSWYRPCPLIARTVEWTSPQTIALRLPGAGPLAVGRDMGFAVLKALGFRTGFTHMEWFLTDSGEAVFGEIGARPPGARSVEIMNVASDIDLYRGWAQAVCTGSLGQEVHRRYNAAIIFKRAQGEGRITQIKGLGELLTRFGPHVTSVDLLPPGSHRRNWKQTLMSDGHIVLRHPDLDTCVEMADRVGTDLRLYAA
jgi:biotin carboxylase